MSQDFFLSSRRATVSSGYRILRGLVRLWISLFFRKMRPLEADYVPETGPALFVVSHPASFLDAVLLVAAFDRQLHCLMDRGLLRGTGQKLLAWGVGMIPYEREGDAWRRAVETACNVLGNSGAVAVFAELQAGETKEASRFAPTAATLALEAESRNGNQLDLMVVPVHLFLPVARLHTSELLVYIDRRILPQAYLLEGKNLQERRRALSTALEEAGRQNVFRLQPEDVRIFLADLEEVLLADLQEDFASRSNWKQKVEGFKLSGFAVEWADQLNFLHPGRLVALRESLNEYREARRRASLKQLEVETAGAWVKSSWRRAVVWAETLVGFPVAWYGLVNHLLAGLFLYAAGALKKQTDLEGAALWIFRAVVVLACYAAQILLCAHFLGRAPAGYYALSLPISGLYLWRYGWLIRHRTRLLFLRVFIPRDVSKLSEMRKEFVKELNAARDAYVQALGIAR